MIRGTTLSLYLMSDKTAYNAGRRLHLSSLEKQSVQKLPGEVGRLMLAGLSAAPALCRGWDIVFYPFIVLISLCVCVMCLLSLKRGGLSRIFINIFKVFFVKRYILNYVKRFYYDFSKAALFFVKHAHGVEDAEGGDAGIGKDSSPHGGIAGKTGEHDDAFDA